MWLTIALRKEVATVEEGQNVMNIVREKLEDHPEVNIQGSVNEVLLNGEE